MLQSLVLYSNSNNISSTSASSVPYSPVESAAYAQLQFGKNVATIRVKRLIKCNFYTHLHSASHMTRTRLLSATV